MLKTLQTSAATRCRCCRVPPISRIADWTDRCGASAPAAAFSRFWFLLLMAFSFLFFPTRRLSVRLRLLHSRKRKGGADAGSSLQRGPAKRGVSDERSPRRPLDCSGVEAGEQTQRTDQAGAWRGGGKRKSQKRPMTPRQSKREQNREEKRRQAESETKTPRVRGLENFYRMRVC